MSLFQKKNWTIPLSGEVTIKITVKGFINKTTQHLSKQLDRS